MHAGVQHAWWPERTASVGDDRNLAVAVACPLLVVHRRTVSDTAAAAQPDSLHKYCCIPAVAELAGTDSFASHRQTVLQRSVVLELELGQPEQLVSAC